MVGIYKITNKINNKCYIGQSVDIQQRWSKHLSAFNGEHTPDYKIYRAFEKYGLQNFTFEVIEECDRSMLNDREDYWQDYFHAKDFGYSIK